MRGTKDDELADPIGAGARAGAGVDVAMNSGQKNSSVCRVGVKRRLGYFTYLVIYKVSCNHAGKQAAGAKRHLYCNMWLYRTRSYTS